MRFRLERLQDHAAREQFVPCTDEGAGPSWCRACRVLVQVSKIRVRPHGVPCTHRAPGRRTPAGGTGVECATREQTVA